MCPPATTVGSGYILSTERLAAVTRNEAPEGIDALDIPTMSEKALYEYFRNGLGLEWVTPRLIRDSIARRELRPNRKGSRFLFSKREAHRWLVTSADDGGDAA